MESPSQARNGEGSKPYFLRNLPISTADFQRNLQHPEPATRAFWMAYVMRAARFEDVWKLVSHGEMREHYALIRRHLGRVRPFWDFLLCWQIALP